MDTTFGFAPVAAITALCYLLGLGLRRAPVENKWIPLCCGVLGAALGLAAYAAGLSLLPAEDPLTAAAVGAVSGWAATGLHQTATHLGVKP